MAGKNREKLGCTEEVTTCAEIFGSKDQPGFNRQQQIGRLLMLLFSVSGPFRPEPPHPTFSFLLRPVLLCLHSPAFVFHRRHFLWSSWWANMLPDKRNQMSK